MAGVPPLASPALWIKPSRLPAASGQFAGTGALHAAGRYESFNGVLDQPFLTPFLAAYDGWSIFTDCDFLYTRDIRQLQNQLDSSKAIQVVQHDYTPALAVKMDGKAQHVYPRKNWSSFIAFNGAHPAVRALTPAVVNDAEPAYLHRFNWVDDAAIGKLDLTWNFLVGEYPKPSETPAAIHYTNGGRGSTIIKTSTMGISGLPSESFI